MLATIRPRRRSDKHGQGERTNGPSLHATVAVVDRSARCGASWDSKCRRSGPSAARHSALDGQGRTRSEEHTSELQSLMRISSAVFCLKKKKRKRLPNAKN